MVGLEAGNLKYDDKQVHILERSQNDFHQLSYDLSGQVRDTKSIRGVGTKKAPDGQTYSAFQQSGIFSALAPLRSVFLVTAHRVVQPQLPLQSETTLTANTQNLAQYLSTLYANNRKQFSSIENFITRVFPEFESVDLKSRNNQVSLSLTSKEGAREIRLSHCGTGVEQLLGLTTFIVTSEPGRMFLLDEPHSYLHPTAEREFIDFLKQNPQHKYVIATHSPVIMNSVPPESIVFLEAGKDSPRRIVSSPRDLTAVHKALGYRNSDFLLSDRIIFVEGPSDTEIMPVLLRQTGEFDEGWTIRTAFISLDGSGSLTARRKQTSIMFREEMLKELGRVDLPRMYLFDGDVNQDDRRLLKGTRGGQLKIQFLPRCELENYLLVPEAIHKALVEQAALEGQAAFTARAEEIQGLLEELLALQDDKKLYPNDLKEDRLREVKGSEVLERIFARFQLAYSKRESGKLIAAHLALQNQPALKEIAEAVSCLSRP